MGPVWIFLVVAPEVWAHDAPAPSCMPPAVMSQRMRFRRCRLDGTSWPDPSVRLQLYIPACHVDGVDATRPHVIGKFVDARRRGDSVRVPVGATQLTWMTLGGADDDATTWDARVRSWMGGVCTVELLVDPG